jgi:DHA3 family macrolide efflux protein-like MFS transporter
VATGLASVILIDFVTFLFAVLTLLVIRFPRPEASAEGAAARGTPIREAASGWAYIAQRPGLLGLLILYAALNFLGITTSCFTLSASRLVMPAAWRSGRAKFPLTFRGESLPCGG